MDEKLSRPRSESACGATPEEDTREEVLAAFLQRYWADVKDRGGPRLLAEYLAVWPEHARVIAREYLAMGDGTAPNGGETMAGVPAGGGGEVSGAGDAMRIGPYRLLHEIGRGGQGEIWLAEDTRLHRTVALKVLTVLGSRAHATLLRFRREAEIAARLEDPGICGVHDSGVDLGTAWIAMPYIDGETLAHQLAALRGMASGSTESEPMGPASGPEVPPEQIGRARNQSSIASVIDSARQREIVKLFEAVARALRAAHEAGVLHRDLKPGNIMITKDGRPVVLDFGLACLEGEDAPSLSQAGDLFGTPVYMSPEQLLGRRIRLDRRSDIWSLGVALYESLTLDRPFEAPTREGLYQAFLAREPERLRGKNPAVSRDLEVVVGTAHRPALAQTGGFPERECQEA